MVCDESVHRSRDVQRYLVWPRCKENPQLVAVHRNARRLKQHSCAASVRTRRQPFEIAPHTRVQVWQRQTGMLQGNETPAELGRHRPASLRGPRDN